jgi:hypothetical protein
MLSTFPRPAPTRPSSKLEEILRMTLSLTDYYGGECENHETLRSLRRALLRAIRELEADYPENSNQSRTPRNLGFHQTGPLPRGGEQVIADH